MVLEDDLIAYDRGYGSYAFIPSKRNPLV